MFKDVFPKKKTVIGMLHLSGRKLQDKVDRALFELRIYEDNGVDGAIFENYHADLTDLALALERAYLQGDLVSPCKIGVNVLPNDFAAAFQLATQFKLDFIQLDYVGGKYVEAPHGFPGQDYTAARASSRVLVLGGMWPKYYTPLDGSRLEVDLDEGMRHADALVVTGSGTGEITPLSKISGFRRHLGDFPLIVGAGTTVETLEDQLAYADGTIVGSAFKPGGNTSLPVERDLVTSYMQTIEKIRGA